MALGLVLACSEPPPPPSVDQLMSDKVLLDATMIRCGADRATRKYEPECVNARDAINRIARQEEDERRAALEAQSERKRNALRRTQQAATLARRRAEEAARRREEEAYLMQFGESPGSTEARQAGDAAISPTPNSGAPERPAPVEEALPAPEDSTPQAPQEQDLQSIRDELKRRQESGN